MGTGGARLGLKSWKQRQGAYKKQHFCRLLLSLLFPFPSLFCQHWLSSLENIYVLCSGNRPVGSYNSPRCGIGFSQSPSLTGACDLQGFPSRRSVPPLSTLLWTGLKPQTPQHAFLCKEVRHELGKSQLSSLCSTWCGATEAGKQW